MAELPDAGDPRSPDGKPDLAAPAPRTADGKPDLSGVWMHELTSVAEVKRLFGDRFDADIKVDVPGMEIGTQHKYAIDILLDFKPGESPLRPEAAESCGSALPTAIPRTFAWTSSAFPRADLLSEPIKIVQSPAYDRDLV